MNCDQINELLAAYALDALDSEDLRNVRTHLVTCRKHDVDLAELGAAASTLAAAPDEIEPPTALRTRVLSAFDAEVASNAGPAPAQRTTQHRGRVVSLTRRPAFAWLAAAALLVAVVGLSTWNVILQTGDGGGEGGWTVSAELSGDGVDGHFWYLDRQQLAVVAMDSMPPHGPARVYQAWGIYDGQPVSLGVMPEEDTVAMKADLEGASAFAITIEPAGGSEQPSGDPVALAELG